VLHGLDRRRPHGRFVGHPDQVERGIGGQRDLRGRPGPQAQRDHGHLVHVMVQAPGGVGDLADGQARLGRERPLEQGAEAVEDLGGVLGGSRALPHALASDLHDAGTVEPAGRVAHRDAGELGGPERLVQLAVEATRRGLGPLDQRHQQPLGGGPAGADQRPQQRDGVVLGGGRDCGDEGQAAGAGHGLPGGSDLRRRAKCPFSSRPRRFRSGLSRVKSPIESYRTNRFLLTR
jgi:hypothetical protein